MHTLHGGALTCLPPLLFFPAAPNPSTHTPLPRCPKAAAAKPPACLARLILCTASSYWRVTPPYLARSSASSPCTAATACGSGGGEEHSVGRQGREGLDSSGLL